VTESVPNCRSTFAPSLVAQSSSVSPSASFSDSGRPSQRFKRIGRIIYKLVRHPNMAVPHMLSQLSLDEVLVVVDRCIDAAPTVRLCRAHPHERT
jgi:hypothetical protein